MSTTDKIKQAITITENELKLEINALKECAKNLIMHAKQGEDLIKDIESGNGYYSGFFGFAEDNIKKAIKAEDRINSLRATLSKLNYALNEND